MTVEIGQSGTNSTAGGSAAGNVCPSLGAFDLLGIGWFQEFKRDISGDPVDEDSDHIINEVWMDPTGLLNGGPRNPHLHVDFSATGASTTSFGGYGIPINVVPFDQPALPFSGMYYPSDPGPVPFSPTGSFEGISPDPTDLTVLGTPPISDDRHVLVLVASEDLSAITTGYEVYQVRTDDGGVNWTAAVIAIWTYSTGIPRPFDVVTGPDAAALPMAPLLLRYEEVASGDIGHVIRGTFPLGIIYGKAAGQARNCNAASSDPHLLNYGGIIRLKADYDISSYSGQARVILEGMKKYGIINSDITGGGLGSGPFINGITDDRWDIDGTTHGIFAIENVPISAFEVVLQRSQYTLDGPTEIEVGEPAVYTVTKYPASDRNYAGTVYMYVNGVYYDPGTRVLVDVVGGLENLSSYQFAFTPTEPGTYVIRSNHGNQVWRDAKPITLTVPTMDTGTLTITETVTGSASGTITVANAVVSVSPSSGRTDQNPRALTVTVMNGVCTQEDVDDLITITGGVGVTYDPPEIVDDDTVTIELLTGGGSGVLTVTHTPTGESGSYGVAAATAYTRSPAGSPVNARINKPKTIRITFNGLGDGVTVTITSDKTGTFSPDNTLEGSGITQPSLTYTPTELGTHTLTFASALTDPSNLVFNVTAAPAGGGNGGRQLLRRF